ncbi:MAG: hypothetical protein AAGU78_15065 [Chloroflexota bacterium]|jgi:hypothetical protein|nr:hypothetical protein [Anaerolineae bacterium]HMM29878.1 hypothetical protein [Aggregatilineaceae bacterium]
MTTQTETRDPQLGRMIGIGVVTLLVLRELMLPRTVLSGVKNVFDVPKDLLRVLLRALLIFKPLIDLIGSLFAIARAALILGVFGVIVFRMMELLGLLRPR